MKVSEQIKARKLAKQATVEKMERMVEAAESQARAFTDTEEAEYEQLKADLTAHDNALARMLDLEEVVSRTASPVSGTGTSVQRATGGVKNREKGGLIFGSIGVLLRAHIQNKTPEAVALEHYRDDTEMQQMVRAVAAPADTTTAGWASELVQDGVSQFVELIRPLTIYGRVPGLRLNFTNKGAIPLPTFGAGGLAGDFVAEGAPIPVKQGVTSSSSFGPNKLAVISTFTREIAQHSNPSIEALIRAAILADTAEVLDARFGDDAAASAIRPAGLRNATATGAGNINAATGTGDAADIKADIIGVTDRMRTARAGSVGCWIMHPTRKLTLEYMENALGGTQFPSVANGFLAGAPILETDGLAENLVIAISQSAMAFGNDFAPEFALSNQTTLHMVDAAPADISAVGTPNTVAAPVQSMFQTDSVALRMCWGLSWKLVRAGGVQVLTSVNWGD